MTLPRKVSVLGSTGSVGVSTLDLFERAGVEVDIVALVAGRNVERLAEQALRHVKIHLKISGCFRS